jgi:hypothetical protein
MSKRTRHGTTTITLSIPTEKKAFFDELAENGYNRSFLMLKLTKMLHLLYDRRKTAPGGLHELADRLLKIMRDEELSKFLLESDEDQLKKLTQFSS